MSSRAVARKRKSLSDEAEDQVIIIIKQQSEDLMKHIFLMHRNKYNHPKSNHHLMFWRDG
jgi:hypothetical protein